MGAPDGALGPGEGGFVGQGEVSSGAEAAAVGRHPWVGKARGTSGPPHRLVRDQTGLEAVRTALADADRIGLDLETTGLEPRKDRVRLLALSIETIDGGRFSYLVDCFAVDPTPLFDVLAEKELVLHNALFDLAFLARRGFVPAGRMRDTMLLAQLVTAGTGERVSLAACCEHWPGLTLDKSEQKSDWPGELTAEQLAYAAAALAGRVPGPLSRREAPPVTRQPSPDGLAPARVRRAPRAGRHCVRGAPGQDPQALHAPGRLIPIFLAGDDRRPRGSSALATFQSSSASLPAILRETTGSSSTAPSPFRPPYLRVPE